MQKGKKGKEAKRQKDMADMHFSAPFGVPGRRGITPLVLRHRFSLLLQIGRVWGCLHFWEHRDHMPGLQCSTTRKSG
jgi:hypothetical protein